MLFAWPVQILCEVNCIVKEHSSKLHEDMTAFMIDPFLAVGAGVGFDDTVGC